MQVTTEQIDPCKIALTISVDTEKVKDAETKAFNQFAKNIQLPGFRKGKVPAAMAKNYVDPSRVKQRAAELLVGPAYEEAVAEANVQPFGGIQPDVELVEFPDDGPLVFKAFVPLPPVVTLGPYKGLALERRLLQVTDEDVERQIEEIRSRQAEYPEITDRSAQLGDVILADLTASIEGEDVSELAEPRSTVIEIGKNIPDFDNGLVGMAIGESKTIDALYPETFNDDNLKGKRATFTVSVKELRGKILPELTEEFVQKVHPTAQNEAELREAVRESLVKTADEMADNELEFELVGKIVDTSTINYPDGLLRAEMQEDVRQLQERLERDKATLEQYLAAVGKTQEEVETEIRVAADRRIRNSLALSEIARTEEISVEDADVDAAIAERAERARVSPAAVRAFAEKNNQLHTFRDQALTEKILAFLKGTSTVTERSVTSEELQAEEAAANAAEAEATAPVEAAEPAEPAEPLAVEAPAKPKRRTKKAAAAEAETAAETAETPATDAA
jgi:trigger factor